MQLEELEKGLKQGGGHCFRMRCQSVLLKTQGMNSNEVSRITGMCSVSINNWVKRYKEEGILGLSTKSGRGRKSILSKRDDSASILSAIKDNRQRMRTAKAQWEAASGKKVCDTTVKAFLKSLAEDINA